MFTWQELREMGVRQTRYWVRQADALDRQKIASTATAVGIARISNPNDRRAAIDELELTQTAAEVKKQLSENAWAMLRIMPKQGGKGV